MEAMNAPIDIRNLIPAWEAFRQATDIRPIRSERHYRRMVVMLEALLEQGAESSVARGADELIDVVGELISEYEARCHRLPETTGVQALSFLMEQHGLRQADLPEIGSQGVVSEVLAGKRTLNVRQIRALAQRFGVSPATFV